MNCLSALFLFACVAHGARAISTGAPPTACFEMKPLHGPDPQPLPAPYTVTASEIDASRYQVTIEADSGVEFKGFFIQARSTLTNTTIGTFETTDLAKSVECFTLRDSASTHVNSVAKTSVSVVWNNPGTEESFFFLASVVQNYNNFWVAIPATLV